MSGKPDAYHGVGGRIQNPVRTQRWSTSTLRSLGGGQESIAGGISMWGLRDKQELLRRRGKGKREKEERRQKTML